MMRIAGRSDDGTAKALGVTNDGAIKISDSKKTVSFNYNQAGDYDPYLKTFDTKDYTSLFVDVNVVDGQVMVQADFGSGVIDKPLIPKFSNGKEHTNQYISLAGTGSGRFYYDISGAVRIAIQRVDLHSEIYLNGALFNGPLPQVKNVSVEEFERAKEEMLTASEQDFKKEKVSEIAEIIGMDDLALFLTLGEESEPFKDYFNRGLQFRSGSAVIGTGRVLNGGPFYRYINLENFNSGVVEKPLVEKTHTEKRSGYSQRLATKVSLGYALPNIGKIRLPLRKVGNVENARIKVEIRQDSDGQPGALLLSKTRRERPAVIDAKASDVRDNWFGFAITDAEDSTPNTFWIVLDYSVPTGIDANNYIGWDYNTDASGVRAKFNGTSWEVISGESHGYEIYDKTLHFDDDFTIINLIKPSTDTVGRVLYGHADASDATIKDLMLTQFKNTLQPRINGKQSSFSVPNEDWMVVGLSFSKEKTWDKTKLYVNGQLVSPNDIYERVGLRGPALKGLDHIVNPLVFGQRLTRAGSYIDSWRGLLGPIIIAKRELGQDEIKKISSILLNGGRGDV